MGEVFAGPGYRTCSRSGCKWPAIASLSFDYGSRRVWLDDLTPEPEPVSYDLCSVHSDRFRAPKGWETQDLRLLPEPLFRPKTELPPAPTPSPEDEELRQAVMREI
jgi:hypothetical protein